MRRAGVAGGVHKYSEVFAVDQVSNGTPTEYSHNDENKILDNLGYNITLNNQNT